MGLFFFKMQPNIKKISNFIKDQMIERSFKGYTFAPTIFNLSNIKKDIIKHCGQNLYKPLIDFDPYKVVFFSEQYNLLICDLSTKELYDWVRPYPQHLSCADAYLLARYSMIDLGSTGKELLEPYIDLSIKDINWVITFNEKSKHNGECVLDMKDPSKHPSWILTTHRQKEIIGKINARRRKTNLYINPNIPIFEP